jgi:uncharacterized protein (DUF2267 family)
MEPVRGASDHPLPYGDEGLFVKSVFEATDFDSKEQAEATAKATLTNLVRRISTGEGTDLVAQLPAGLKDDVARAAQETERFSLDEFFERVARDDGGSPIAPSPSATRAVPACLQRP